MAITAWAIRGWQLAQVASGAAIDNDPQFPAALRDFVELVGIEGRNIPPMPNVGAWRLNNIPDKATLDVLDAAPGVIILAAVNDDGTRVQGYLRPQDTPTLAQLNAAKTRLQNAGIPTGTLTSLVTVGMTTAQVADALRGYARDLTKAQAQQVKEV